MLVRYITRTPQFYRGLATHAGRALSVPATLHLKTGQSFYGQSFGAPKSVYGETVFSTSITSCMFYPLLSRSKLIFAVRYGIHDGPLLPGSNPCLHHTYDR
jgi:hypothetical protein